MRFTTLDGLRAWLDRLAQETDLVAPRDVDGLAFYYFTKHLHRYIASIKLLDYWDICVYVVDCMIAFWFYY